MLIDRKGSAHVSYASTPDHLRRPLSGPFSILTEPASRKVNEMILPWSSFNSLGKSATVKSSYVWVVLVPVLAKVLSRISRDFSFSIFDVRLTFVLGVPFTWELLYYSAICFALANLIYTFFCPEIVRNYDRFSDFEAQGKGGDQLVLYAYGRINDGTFSSPFRGIGATQVLRFIQAYVNGQFGIETQSSEYMERIQSKPIYSPFHPRHVQISNAALPAAFWFIRQAYDRHSWAARAAVQFMFSAGFVLLAWVMAQNFWYVVSQHVGANG